MEQMEDKEGKINKNLASVSFLDSQKKKKKISVLVFVKWGIIISFTHYNS